MTLNGSGGRGAGSNHGVSLSSTAITSTGDLSITTTATGKCNIGVYIAKESALSAATMSIIGTGGRGSGRSNGIGITKSSLTTASGDLPLTGTARSNTGGVKNIGVSLFSSVSLISAGAIDITGTGGGGSKFNYGVYMHRDITAAGANVTGTAGSGTGSKAKAGDFFA